MILSIAKDVIAFGAINLAYFTALEVNPKTKGIVRRPDSENNKKFSPESIKEFMLSPFRCKPGTNELWKPQNWDINYPVVMVGCFGAYKCLLG